MRKPVRLYEVPDVTRRYTTKRLRGTNNKSPAHVSPTHVSRTVANATERVCTRRQCHLMSCPTSMVGAGDALTQHWVCDGMRKKRHREHPPTDGPSCRPYPAKPPLLEPRHPATSARCNYSLRRLGWPSNVSQQPAAHKGRSEPNNPCADRHVHCRRSALGVRAGAAERYTSSESPPSGNGPKPTHSNDKQLASVADDNRRNAKGRRCVLVATSRPTAWGDHRIAVRKRWRRCVRLPTTMAGIRAGVAGSSDLVQGSPANAVLRIVCIVPSRAGGARLRRPLGEGGRAWTNPNRLPAPSCAKP